MQNTARFGLSGNSALVTPTSPMTKMAQRRKEKVIMIQADMSIPTG